MATLTYKKEKRKEIENRLKYTSYLKSFKKIICIILVRSIL